MTETECVENSLSLEPPHLSTYLSRNPLDLFSLTPLTARKGICPGKEFHGKQKWVSLWGLQQRAGLIGPFQLFSGRICSEARAATKRLPEEWNARETVYLLHLCSNKYSCLDLPLAAFLLRKSHLRETAAPEMENMHGLHSCSTCSYWTD